MNRHYDKLYGLGFIARKIFSLFPISDNKVSYLPANLEYSGNAKAIYELWNKQYPMYKHIWFTKSCDISKRNTNTRFVQNGLVMLLHLMTSKYWIKETEFKKWLIIPRKGTKVIQLWHAAGAFKKFGVHARGRKNVMNKEFNYWDLVFCSSKHVVDIYSEAFGGFDKSKIVVNGLPRNDFLYTLTKKKNLIRRKLGIPSGRKLIMYAPTFRDKMEKSGYVFILELITQVKQLIDEGYSFGVRLHPRIPIRIEDIASYGKDIVDLGKCTTEEAIVASDVLITDYSSIIFDFALLEKPMIFYAHDLKNYYNERGFYFSYESFVPGPIAYNSYDLTSTIKNYDLKKWIPIIREFRNKFNPFFDGKNSERALKKILELKE